MWIAKCDGQTDWLWRSTFLCSSWIKCIFVFFLSAAQSFYRKKIKSMWILILGGISSASELNIKGWRNLFFFFFFTKITLITKHSIMPRHKDIRSLETIPAATTQKESLPGSAPTSFPLCFQPLFVSNISKSKKILTRLNRFRAAWMSMWQSDLSEGKRSSEGTLLSFDWETVLIFYSVVGRQWRRASTNHLHVHQINLPGLTPQDWVSGGTVDLSTFSQVRIRRDFLSFLSPFVSFITLVVISRSWDFFLLSAQWKVDKRPLCLLTPSFPFNKLFFFFREETPSQPPSQKEADNQEGVSTSLFYRRLYLPGHN